MLVAYFTLMRPKKQSRAHVHEVTLDPKTGTVLAPRLVRYLFAICPPNTRGYRVTLMLKVKSPMRRV